MMESFFNKLIRTEDLHRILDRADAEKGISIGDVSTPDIDALIRFYNLWTSRIDSIIKIDKSVNGGKAGKYAQMANQYRGFTYHEFEALFNKAITNPSEFPFYPVYNQLLYRSKTGIRTERERNFFTSQHEYDKENYLNCLLSYGHEPVCMFFQRKARYKAYLPLKYLFRHAVFTGGTGSGKTTLLDFLFYRLTKKYKKYSFLLIDPHGELSRKAKRLKIFQENPDRLIYFNPFFQNGYTPGINPFDIGGTSLASINHAADNLIIALEEVLSLDDKFSEVQINTLEKIIFFLLGRKESTMSDLKALLNLEEDLVKEAFEYDPVFFGEDFQKPNNRARQALLHRVSRLLNSPVLNNVLSGQSTIDLEGSMNSGKVILFDLGDMSEMAASSFSKFLVATIKSIGRKREKGKGLPTFLMVDEAHLMLCSNSCNYIFEQLRGFSIHALIAHQYPNQFSPPQKETIRRNAAIKISAGVEEDSDEKPMLKIPKGTPHLKDYEFYLKLKNKPIQIVKAPKKFVRNRAKYEMSNAEERKLDKLQLERYYKVIGQPEFKKRKGLLNKDIDKKKATSPTPPFQLKIDPDD